MNIKLIFPIVIFTYILLITMPANAIVLPDINDENDITIVTWGSKKGNPVLDTLPPAVNGKRGYIEFYWTQNDSRHPEYGKYYGENKGKQAYPHMFYMPYDDTITDYRQVLESNGNKICDVTLSAVKNGSPWEFFPLSHLPNISYKVPDFAAVGADDADAITIYEEVDLLRYMTSNPLGFLNGDFAFGDMLDSLKVKIVNGQIPGVEGLYFALSPFTFDPNSTTGLVPSGGDSTLLNSVSFQAEHGALGIIGVHETIPEPATLLLFGMAAGGILFKARKLGRQTGAG